ncbi:MAG: CRISPR-associated endonuclease Cas2 [bacterium]
MIREKKLIVVYDIVDDKRRRNLYKLLKSYGIRTQYSFFECLLSERQQETLKFKILDIIEPSEDKVGFIHLCDSCFDQIKRYGYSEPEMFRQADLVF